VTTTHQTDHAEALQLLRENIAKVFLGHPDVIDRLLACLLAKGHALIEDVPGVGKTLLATALARSLGCDFSRIQMTPDLLPADVLGVSILDRNTQDFRFRKGPVFANIILADEINRTTPRTQSALLEAMNDSSVSVEGQLLPLPQPFMVVATQNPVSFEGTYPLPENQLDRFLMKLAVGYPSQQEEARVLDNRPSDDLLAHLAPVLSAQDVIDLQAAAEAVRLEPVLRDYIIAIATVSRAHDELAVGISPRGTLAMAAAARAVALVRGRDYCIPEDITSLAIPVFAHRVVSRSYLSTGDTAGNIGVVEQVLRAVDAPD